MLRRGQDRFRRLLPGGHGAGAGIVIAIVAIAVLWLASGFYRVQPDEVGVVLRFGAYNRKTEPGLNYHLPTPVESVTLFGAGSVALERPLTVIVTIMPVKLTGGGTTGLAICRLTTSM